MTKTWDEWYKLAKKYARTHKGTIASIKEDYVTSDGDKLGAWVQSQRFAYKNRDIPKERRNRNYSILTDDQVIKLEELGMIWDFRKNTEEIRSICMNYLTYEEYRKSKKILDRIPLRIFEAKINYCLENDIPLIVGTKLNRFFTISSVNLEKEYGINLEDLLAKEEKKKELN